MEFVKYRYLILEGNSVIAELQNVISEFKYKQAINTAGAEIEIEIGSTLTDVGAELVVENLVDFNGDFVVDEAGNNVLGSSDFEFTDIPIDLGNRIQVYREDEDNPNGVVVFDGLISSWRGSHLGNTIKIKVVSWGVQLQNFIVGAGSTGAAVAQETADIEYDLTMTLGSGDKGLPQPDNTLAQTFVLATDTIVPSISIKIRTSGFPILIPMNLFSGTPASPGSRYGYVEKYIYNTDSEYIDFIFSSPLELPAGTYYWDIQNYGYNASEIPTAYLAANSAGGYASGALYDDAVDTGDDAAFIVNTNAGEVSTSFDQTDPGNIIRSLLARLAGQGSIITYDEDTVELTNTSSSYGFILATALEGIQKAKDLAPSHWYWYLDVATNYLHFHARGDTPDHVFKLGTHIHDLDFGFSLEEVKNTVYFSGGDTGAGVNLLVTDQNSSSQERYGQWLERISDNRVTDEATAQTIITGILNERSGLSFKSRLAIPAKVYDIESITIGEMVGFSNFNNLIDSLVLQITAIDKSANLVWLDLDSVPPRVSATIEDLRKRLIAQETVDNPDAPS